MLQPGFEVGNGLADGFFSARPFLRIFQCLRFLLQAFQALAGQCVLNDCATCHLFLLCNHGGFLWKQAKFICSSAFSLCGFNGVFTIWQAHHISSRKRLDSLENALSRLTSVASAARACAAITMSKSLKLMPMVSSVWQSSP